MTDGAPASSPPAAGQPDLPPGHRFVTLAERPDLTRPMDVHNGTAWPEFMFHDQVAAEHWHRLAQDWPSFQGCLLDPDGGIVAAFNSAPIRWDGTDDGLPSGWDDQFERSVAQRGAGTEPNSLGAIQIVVAQDGQGRGLASLTLHEMRATGRRHGLGSVIACVRPTDKARYPLMSIDRYAAWCRSDGLPVDPWLRIHARAGGRVVRASPRSMTMTGTLAEWREWTGLDFPVSGPYHLPFATNPVEIDLAVDLGTYHDANIWVVHDPLA